MHYALLMDQQRRTMSWDEFCLRSRALGCLGGVWVRLQTGLPSVHYVTQNMPSSRAFQYTKYMLDR